LAHCIADKARVIPTASAITCAGRDRLAKSSGFKLTGLVISSDEPHFSESRRSPLRSSQRSVERLRPRSTGRSMRWPIQPMKPPPPPASCLTLRFHAYQKFNPPGEPLPRSRRFHTRLPTMRLRRFFEKARANKDVTVASKPFVPSGLFTDGRARVMSRHRWQSSPSCAQILHQKNRITKRSFYWALVETLGGTYDVVIDPACCRSFRRPAA